MKKIINWQISIFTLSFFVLLGLFHSTYGEMGSAVNLSISKEAFNSETSSIKIDYSLENLENAHIVIKIIDSSFSVINIFDEGIKNEGSFSLDWNGKDGEGNSVPEGNYTIQIEALKHGKDTYEFENSWGVFGSGNGQFNSPRGIDIDSKESIYVADTSNSRIQKFDSNGNFNSKWNGYYTPRNADTFYWSFNQPFGLSVDSHDDVYIANTKKHNLVKVDENGEFWHAYNYADGSFGKTFGKYHFPHSVDVDISGNLYVADTYNHRIQKIGPDWCVVGLPDSPGENDGQFYYPGGVAVDLNGNFYVADTYNHRIQKFDANCRFIKKWGTYGNGDGQFKYPRGIEIDDNGDIYVVDSENSIIKKFDGNGNFISKFGNFGSNNGQFLSPWDLAFSPDGSMYVTDTGNNRIQKFSLVKQEETILHSEKKVTIDNTAPEIIINSPKNGGHYTLNSTVESDWSVSDDGSGISSSVGTVESGQMIDTNSIGLHNFSVTSTDKAGNMRTKTIIYTVAYVFSGFLSPLQDDKNFNPNSVIPVRFQLKDAHGNAVSNAYATLQINGVDAVSSGRSNDRNIFRYDDVSDQYVFNLSLKNSNVISDGFVLQVTLDDGSVHGNAFDPVVILPENVNISDLNPSVMMSSINDEYFTLDTGTISDTSSVTTMATISMGGSVFSTIFPTDTIITGDGSFDFQKFIATSQNVKKEQPTSISAIRFGIPNENLSFSQDITVTVNVPQAYNTQTLNILYQQEGESTWHTHGTCTITNGQCTFQTNHATIYTINGVHQATGDLPLNINVEVQDTLSMNCFDPSDNNATVQIGTMANPGQVTAGTPAVGRSRCTVTTNDDQGYYLTLVNDNTTTHPTLTHTDPHTGTIYEIPEFTPAWTTAIHTTDTWTAPTTKGLGFSVINFPQTDITHNALGNIWNETTNCPEGIAADTNDYAGIPDTPQAITAVTAYQANATTTDICYKVDVLPSQPSGQYTGSVTFTATSDASGYWE